MASGPEVKVFEVRDNGTFMVVMAVRLGSANDAERYLLGRAGFGITDDQQREYVVVAMLYGSPGNTAHYFPPHWGGNTTMVTMHRWLEENLAVVWPQLESGAVIDVEYLRGRARWPKLSERIDPYGESADPKRLPVSPLAEREWAPWPPPDTVRVSGLLEER